MNPRPPGPQPAVSLARFPLWERVCASRSVRSALWSSGDFGDQWGRLWGVRTQTAGVGSKVRESEAWRMGDEVPRLHPDDIEAIADAVASRVRSLLDPGGTRTLWMRPSWRVSLGSPGTGCTNMPMSSVQFGSGRVKGLGCGLRSLRRERGSRAARRRWLPVRCGAFQCRQRALRGHIGRGRSSVPGMERMDRLQSYRCRSAGSETMRVLCGPAPGEKRRRAGWASEPYPSSVLPAEPMVA